MVETLVDIALEFNASYTLAKKNKVENTKENIFLGILKDLYEIYGVYFGYEHSEQGLSDFKSDLIHVKNRLKKEKEKMKTKISSYHHPDPDEIFWKAVKLKPIWHPDEGAGAILVLWEAENWGTGDLF